MDDQSKMNGKVTPNSKDKNLPLEDVDPAELSQQGSKTALYDVNPDCKTGSLKVRDLEKSNFLLISCTLIKYP